MGPSDLLGSSGSCAQLSSASVFKLSQLTFLQYVLSIAKVSETGPKSAIGMNALPVVLFAKIAATTE